MPTAANYILYEGVVFQRVGEIDELDLETPGPTGLEATTELLHYHEVLQPGDPIPDAPFFSRKRSEIVVQFDDPRGHKHLLDRGVARTSEEGD